MKILAIDSGEHQGWASLPFSCGLGEVPHGAWNLIVVEYPVVRPGGKANPNDLIKQALRAGLSAGRATPSTRAAVVFVKPETWKGQLTKEVTANRWLARHADDECRRHAWRIIEQISPGRGRKGDWLAGKRHNVVDALCLLDWATERAAALAQLGPGPSFL